ncbi:hypothetical protein ACWGQL_27515 [Streptomyces lydicus]
MARTPAAPHLPAPRAARDIASATAGTTLRIDGGAGPYDSWFLVATLGGEESGRAVSALAEALGHSPAEPFAAGRRGGRGRRR